MIFSNICIIGNFVVFFPGVYPSDSVAEKNHQQDNVYVLDLLTNHWFKNTTVKFPTNNRLGSGSLAGRDYYFIDGLEPERNSERSTFKVTLIPEHLKAYASSGMSKEQYNSKK